MRSCPFVLRRRFVRLLLSLLLCPAVAGADESPARDANSPLRTDTANPQLSGYQLKPGEFPPKGSEHRVSGYLLEADYIHRRGQFRDSATGDLTNFALPPYGAVMYCNAEADLRDVPLGTLLTFYLYPASSSVSACARAEDVNRPCIPAVLLRDSFTELAEESLTYRLDEVKLDDSNRLSGKLQVTKHGPSPEQSDLGHSELLVNEQTRVWKGSQPAKLSDLVAGDELLVNLAAGRPQAAPRCSDIWIGAESHKLTTEQQRKQHIAFLKQRGLPAWIDRVDGNRLTITFFGDPAGLAALLKDERVDLSQWAAQHERVDTVVATEELRTYNPPVDRQRSAVLEIQTAPTDVYGSSGMRWVIEPRLLLEGFRKGRIVRIFAHHSWKVDDMPFGENVYTEDPNERQEVDEAIQYPFRTDFANEHLPWYRLEPGVFPPFNSQHLMSGELTKVDPVHRAGQFRADGTGELLSFTLLPFGYVLSRNGEAELDEVPLGTRCFFYLHPDASGAFTQASVVMDGFSRFASEKYTYRIESLSPNDGKLLLAKQHAPVKNYHGDFVSPPPLGHAEFTVDDATRVWKLDQQIKLSDLAVGDELLLNTTGRTTTGRGRCTDIWVGIDTHKLAAEQQLAKHNALLKQRGVPGWIESVEDKNLTIMFFGAHPKELKSLLCADPWGKTVHAVLVDDQLNPLSAGADKMGFKNHLPENKIGGVYGCSGLPWVLELSQPSEEYRPGRVVRVFQHDWPVNESR